MQIFLSSFGVELKICKLVFLLLLFEDSYVNQTYLIFFHLVLQKKKKVGIWGGVFVVVFSSASFTLLILLSNFGYSNTIIHLDWIYGKNLLQNFYQLL